LLPLLALLLLLQTKHLGVNLVLARDGGNSPGGGFALSTSILVAAAFVKVDKLLVTDEQISNVHISIRS
jgi:hypothetical protein